MVSKTVSPRVMGIRRLAIQMPDLGQAETFYRDVWQLRSAGSDGGYCAFRTATADHNDFLISEGPQQLNHLAFAVHSVAELDSFAERLAQAGFATTRLNAANLQRGDLDAVTVWDPDGRQIWLVVPQQDSMQVRESCDPLAPQRIGHVVLWTPSQSVAEQFYELLGFQVSDRTNLGMSFLRCNADHHTLALAKSHNGKTGLQHLAFDVGSLDSVMRNFARLRDSGVACAWGVGRHGPGNNVFSYYTDPAGNYIEYYGEMEQFPADEMVEARFWGPEHKGDIWGVTGIPPLSFRE